MAERRGIGLMRKQILAKTSTLYTRTKISSSNTTFGTGEDWLEGGFKRSHPFIRKPENFESTRARMMNREVINKYVNDFGTIVDGLNKQDKPHLTSNCDEMGNNFEHDPVRIVAEKDVKTYLSKTSSKSNIMTIMACVNASGRRMSPMFINVVRTSAETRSVTLAGTTRRWRERRTDDDVVWAGCCDWSFCMNCIEQIKRSDLTVSFERRFVQLWSGN